MADIVGGNQIALGTKQYLLVEVTDVAEQVTDLSTHTPKYTVEDDANAKLYDDQAGIATGMTVYCLIDTTVAPGAGAWVAGAHYRLWAKFTIAPEIPYLGPFDFYVI